MFLTDELTMVI